MCHVLLQEMRGDLICLVKYPDGRNLLAQFFTGGSYVGIMPGMQVATGCPWFVNVESYFRSGVYCPGSLYAGVGMHIVDWSGSEHEAGYS